MSTSIEYTLDRSKRKTIAIYVRNGRVEVRAPMKASIYDIDSFVTSKEHWIRDRLAISIDQMKQRQNFVLDYGSFIAYCGKQYTITACENGRLGFDNSNNCFYTVPNLTGDQLKSECVKAYRLLAESDLSQRVAKYSDIMGVYPTAVKINAAKAFGSCCSRKILKFSWRLIMADNEAIDYVVVHELAHIKEMNHSARFWAVVESVLPDYRERKIKLKYLQRKLNTENWN